MNARYALAALALCLMAVPAGTAAQSALDDLEIRLIPRAGAVTPAGWFYVEYAHFGVNPLEWTEAAVMEAATVGLAAELRSERLGLSVRGEVLRTVDADTRLGHKILNSSFGNTQPTVSTEYHWVPVTLTTATVDIVLPTRFRLPFGIQPYVTAGAGAKFYSFDVAVIENPARTLQLPEEGTTAVLNVGGGVSFTVLGLDVDLVARDAISEYWEEQQHDVYWLAGVSWRVF